VVPPPQYRLEPRRSRRSAPWRPADGGRRTRRAAGRSNSLSELNRAHPPLDRSDILLAQMVAGVTEAIEAADAMAIYLPAYSPDLNPIEQVFSKLKALLRKAAERTIPGLWRRIRSILRTVSKKECLNFFRHAGYE
jgi:transposase